MIYFALLIFWVVVTVLFWRQADRRARRFGGAVGAVARLFFLLFFLPLVAYMAIPLTRPLLVDEPFVGPTVWLTFAYIWFPFLLQLLLAAVATKWLWCRAKSVVARRSKRAAETQPSGDVAPLEDTLSRRGAMALAASFAGPLAAIACTGAAVRQYGRFGVRRVELSLASLPADLDGVTIAHVTDVHAGQFFDTDAAARLADMVNGLNADLVAFTGDLLDRGLLSRLPIGMRFLERLDRRHGFAFIEGNHDVHEDALAFEKAMLDAGVPLLMDQERTYAIPGRSTAVQFLGVSWGPLKYDDDDDTSIDPPNPRKPGRAWSDAWAASSTAAVAAMRRPGAFPILLAHHPHTIAPASALNLPLTLAGHTHGGQLMLTDNIGAGPVRFKYWTGEHLVGNSKLMICNGVGSWFPLRFNAPAEVLHLTLRRGDGVQGR
ncbi:metallophosphoesterase [Humisphaera borealis]|uniref:Metallophosphoesterase n=1 Tax=Humisphaera borealis TaxID=2807512 RepID=A0A7M2WSJ1_9BACT|nr:metallophosphoesterase [Humisphaera borealis]QOV88244.1 metallophosphoesterase [Humisphaera borealis]